VLAGASGNVARIGVVDDPPTAIAKGGRTGFVLLGNENDDENNSTSCIGQTNDDYPAYWPKGEWDVLFCTFLSLFWSIPIMSAFQPNIWE
jgi:hypothetical protein